MSSSLKRSDDIEMAMLMAITRFLKQHLQGIS
jgi:hypothetical protein